jgi:hypothetical protein
MITAIDIHTKLTAAARVATPWTSMLVFGAGTAGGSDLAPALRYAP